MTDSFGRKIEYLRLSVTDLCNLRCRYCMPAEGIEKKLHSEMLTEEEMIQAVEIAAELGVTKLRITGGEPLVKKNILSICERASSVLGIEDLAITTNGILLPEMAAALKVCGVKRVNISLDTLNAGKYRRMTKCGDLDAALAGLHAALECGFEKVKVNAVLIGGFNDDEIPELADITRELPVDLRFIELMPMPCQCEFGTDSYIPCSRVNEALPELEMLDETDGVARMFRLPKARGRIGLISPLSAHFCGDCDRLRLTADGKIKPCLHSSQEYPIKGLDRNGVREQFLAAVQAKPRWHGTLSKDDPSKAGRNMIQIGG